MSQQTTPQDPTPPRDPAAPSASAKAEEPKAWPPLDAKLFMPPEGNLEEQIALQVGFMTQGVMECVVRSSGIFDLPLPQDEVQSRNDYGYDRRKRNASSSFVSSPRSVELRDAAHLSNATARLIAAHAKLRGEFHFTYSRVMTVPGRAAANGSCTEPDGNNRSAPRRKFGKPDKVRGA